MDHIHAGENSQKLLVSSETNIYDLSCKQKTYALFGLLLGDGYYHNGELQCTHTNKQRDYVKFLAKLFREWGILQRKRYDYTKRTTYGEYTYSQVVAKLSQPMREKIEKDHRFYGPSGNKIISKFVLRRINNLGLLLWWLDDGSLCVRKVQKGNGSSTNRIGTLNTQGFSKENSELAVIYLLKRFGIKCGIHKDSSVRNGMKYHYHKIYFNATAMRKLIDIVRPYLAYIPESMLYKFDMKYEPNHRHTNSEYANLYNKKVYKK